MKRVINKTNLVFVLLYTTLGISGPVQDVKDSISCRTGQPRILYGGEGGSQTLSLPELEETYQVVRINLAPEKSSTGETLFLSYGKIDVTQNSERIKEQLSRSHSVENQISPGEILDSNMEINYIYVVATKLPMIGEGPVKSATLSKFIVFKKSEKEEAIQQFLRTARESINFSNSKEWQNTKFDQQKWVSTLYWAEDYWHIRLNKSLHNYEEIYVLSPDGLLKMMNSFDIYDEPAVIKDQLLERKSIALDCEPRRMPDIKIRFFQF